MVWGFGFQGYLGIRLEQSRIFYSSYAIRCWGSHIPLIIAVWRLRGFGAEHQGCKRIEAHTICATYYIWLSNCRHREKISACLSLCKVTWKYSSKRQASTSESTVDSSPVNTYRKMASGSCSRKHMLHENGRRPGGWKRSVDTM